MRSVLPGEVGRLTDDELRHLLVALVRNYAARAEEGFAAPFPLTEEPPTPTEVLVLVTDLLHAADLELFELGMWQTWGGVRGSDPA